MKRVFWICLLLLISFYSSAQEKIIHIGENTYIIKNTESENDNSPEPYREIEIYKEEEKLLTHVIADIGGDCNSESVSLGTYEIKNNELILYSYWARAGDAPVSPYGVRKQVYESLSDGSLSLKKGDIYVETVRENWKNNLPPAYEGMQYLFKEELTQEETASLNKYEEAVKTEYQSTHFVNEKEKDQLFKEVKKKLKKEIKKATRRWETYPFGYKK